MSDETHTADPSKLAAYRETVRLYKEAVSEVERASETIDLKLWSDAAYRRDNLAMPALLAAVYLLEVDAASSQRVRDALIAAGQHIQRASNLIDEFGGSRDFDLVASDVSSEITWALDDVLRGVTHEDLLPKAPTELTWRLGEDET